MRGKGRWVKAKNLTHRIQVPREPVGNRRHDRQLPTKRVKMEAVRVNLMQKKKERTLGEHLGV